MALEGTHIRFALDVADHFEVDDIKKYVSGTVYPDSRYPTGIDRELTHHDDYLKREFWEGDDFKKGWVAHLLCDKVQFALHGELFSEILKADNPEMTGEEDWITRTALKILQDIEDVGKFEIKDYLHCLEYTEAPNDEHIKDLESYNNLFIDIYSKAPNVTIEDLERMWVAWSISPDIAQKMSAKSRKIQDDDVLMKKVASMYDEMLLRSEEAIVSHCN